MVDADNDGRVGIRDFSQIGSWEPEKEEASDAVRKMMVEKLRTVKDELTQR